MNMINIEPLNPKISLLCRKLQIKRLALFGSAAKEDFSDNSDIDVLVEFERNKEDLFDRYFELKENLEKLFSRTVDLIVESAVKNPYFKESIDQNKINLYAA